MVGIIQADGHYDVTNTDVSPFVERLLNPELFQFHFTAFLGFLFPFATFFVFLLVGNTVAAMLELNLCAEAPALAEIIADGNGYVRDVETSVTGIVLMCFGLTVTADVVAIEKPISPYAPNDKRSKNVFLGRLSFFCTSKS